MGSKRRVGAAFVKPLGCFGLHPMEKFQKAVAGVNGGLQPHKWPSEWVAKVISLLDPTYRSYNPIYNSKGPCTSFL